ncbi:MAG: MlaD family protein, partial [Thermodesulfobacteriota bacterium]
MSEPIVETKKGISPVWILPLLAICVGGWLLFKSYRDAGIDIHLRVDDAVGITVGKTPVIFKGAKVGLVKKIEATADLQGMVLTIEMSKKAKSHLVEDVAFWVEKVEVQAGRVTGLDTLLSGGYIGMQLGSSLVPSLEFTALSSRPPVPENAPGLHLNLVADTLYSVQVGSGIYHKSILIGSVQEY